LVLGEKRAIGPDLLAGMRVVLTNLASPVPIECRFVVLTSILKCRAALGEDVGTNAIPAALPVSTPGL
jgi:hypothetical protein